MSVLCSKRLSYVDSVLRGTAIETLCSLRFLLTSNGEKAADEVIRVKKGGIYVVFQPPFYQYEQELPLVSVICNIQSKSRPAR